MPEIATSIVKGGVLTERERLTEIDEIAHNQLSHETDLPKSPQVLINGSRLSFKEIPLPPQIIELHEGGGYALPESERTYIQNRTWTLNTSLGKDMILAIYETIKTKGTGDLYGRILQLLWICRGLQKMGGV